MGVAPKDHATVEFLDASRTFDNNAAQEEESAMKLTPCDCRAAYYARVKRSPWMHLAFGRKLYRCHACEALMLLDPSDVTVRRNTELGTEDTVPDMFPATVAHYRS